MNLTVDAAHPRNSHNYEVRKNKAGEGEYVMKYRCAPVSTGNTFQDCGYMKLQIIPNAIYSIT
jgi:hypothetical protein